MICPTSPASSRPRPWSSSGAAPLRPPSGRSGAPWANEPWAQQPAPGQQSPAEEAAAHAEHGTVGPTAAEIEAAEIIDVSGEHADEIAVSVDREESMREGTMREEPR